VFYVSKYGHLLQVLMDGSSVQKEQSCLKLAYAVTIAMVSVHYEIFDDLMDKTVGAVCNALLVTSDSDTKTCPDYTRLIQFHFPTRSEYELLSLCLLCSLFALNCV